jgi:predicted glutamine amidotransferase
MCIAILNQSGIITESIIRTCANNNPDGMGMAWIENGTIKTFKSMKDISKLVSLYQAIRAENELPIMLHFRIGTHGKKDVSNVHPFHIGDNMVMCHNGIVDAPILQPDKSDTFHLSLFLSKLRTIENLIDTDSIEFLFTETYCGDYSKLIFLDQDGRFSIANEDLGHWIGETWYSNKTYLTSDSIDIGGRSYKKDRKFDSFDSDWIADSHDSHSFSIDDYLIYNDEEEEYSSLMLKYFCESFGIEADNVDGGSVDDWNDEDAWELDNWIMFDGKLTHIGAFI